MGGGVSCAGGGWGCLVVWGCAGSAELAGAGVVDEVDAAVGCEPEVDAGEGLV